MIRELRNRLSFFLGKSFFLKDCISGSNIFQHVTQYHQIGGEKGNFIVRHAVGKLAGEC